MKFTITVNIQQYIGRPAVLLTRVRDASRIHSDDIIIPVDEGLMGMTEENHIAAMLSGHVLNTHRIKAHAVPMAMGHKYFMPSNDHDFFGRHRREKIIIAADHMHRTGRNILDIPSLPSRSPK